MTQRKVQFSSPIAEGFPEGSLFANSSYEVSNSIGSQSAAQEPVQTNLRSAVILWVGDEVLATQAEGSQFQSLNSHTKIKHDSMCL